MTTATPQPRQAVGRQRLSSADIGSLGPSQARAYHRLVGTTSAHGLVAAGQDAVRAGDFDAAARYLQAALAIESTPEAHDALGYLGYVEDDFEQARRQWELAYQGYLAAGDLRGAGLAAVHLASTLYDGFLDGPGSRRWLGWLRRFRPTPLVGEF